MQLIKSLSKSKVMRIVALALVLAGAVSFQKAVLADAGDGDRTLIIRAFEGDPLNDKKISGVNLRVNGGPDDGLTGTTDGNGTFVFHVHEGNFAVTASHSDFYTIDIPVFMDIGELTVDVSMTPKVVVNPPIPPTTPGSECTPTPPRGRPMLNIWPIATSGADCTDYPLLSVKNVTQNSGWVSGDAVNANAGDTILVELYVHNGVLDYPDNIANNVMVHSAVNGNVITAQAWADNADRITSAQKGGNASVNLGAGMSLGYIPGSAKLYDRNMTNARALSDEIIGGGASIGDMRGCFEFLHLVTFELKVNAPVVQTGTIRVVKEVINNNGGTAAPTDFPLFVNGQAVGHNATNTFNVGSYTITETNKAGYNFAHFSGDCNGSGVINLTNGMNAVCTVTNDDVQVVTGTIGLTKNVRNVTQNQTTFVPQIAANPGDQVEFQMVVTASTAAVNNVIFSDTLPAKLTYVQNSLTVEGVPSGNNLGAVSLGNLAANTSKKIIIRATVGTASEFPVGSTTLTNTANVSSSVGNATATAKVVVSINANTKISIDKQVRNVTANDNSFSDTTDAKPGDTLEFRLFVTVTGNTPATGIVVTDTLPVGKMTFVTGETGTRNLDDIAPGKSTTVLIRAVVKGESEFPCTSTGLANEAKVTSVNAGSDTDLAHIAVIRTCTSDASLTIEKLARNVTQDQSAFLDSIAANPKDIVQFQIKVTANGNTTAQNVKLTDVLPNHMTLVTGSSLTHDLGNMTAGSSKTVTISAALGENSDFNCGANALVNKATADASNTDAVSDNATVNVNRTTNCGGTVSLTINKVARNVTQNQTTYTESVSANPGDTIQFQIQVTPNGAVNNVVVTDTLPSNMSLSSGSLTNTLGNISSAQTVTLNAVVASESNFSCGSTTLTNTASATASNANTVSDNANVVVTRSSNCGGGGSNPSLTLTKEVRNVTKNTGFTNSTTAANGERVEFRLIVRNVGNAAANNVRVTDFLPSGLTYVPGTFQIDSGISSGSLFNGNYQSLGTMSSGSVRTILFQANVDSNATQTLINQATATSDNSNSANAQATVFVSTVQGGNIDLILSKSAWNQTRNVDATTVTAQAGDVIVYTLRVRNNGNATATNYVFTDDITDVLQLSRLHTFDGAAFDMSRLTVTWPAVSIAPGATVEKTFSVVVNGAVGPTVDNVMTNVFGNTVNVRVPRTAGFVAPPTGTGTTISLGLAFATMIGFWSFRKQKVQSLIKFLTHKNV
jgi:uncharacterized repeat protein (TIGR01451 family)